MIATTTSTRSDTTITSTNFNSSNHSYFGSNTTYVETYSISRYPDYDWISETVTEASLRRLKELIFIPIKLRLVKIPLVQKKQINIRNQLPRKIRND